MFEITIEELEQCVKEYEKIYNDNLEDLKKDNEYLIKNSERLYRARIDLLEAKLKGGQNE